METEHYQLWSRCREFVGEVCAGRDASHGLAHMETVTQNAILILLMQHHAACDLPVTLSRVILVAMLHDVADHKYDTSGTLLQQVKNFIVQDEVASVVVTKTAESQHHIITTIEAISFSKEKSRVKRWFEAELPVEWLLVRDVVSDADKLEAIGKSGLQRCLLYSAHILLKERETENREEQEQQVWDAALQQRCLQNVKKHFAEKLALLSTDFIVTPTGKFLAAPRHVAMLETLQRWEQNGLPFPF